MLLMILSHTYPDFPSRLKTPLGLPGADFKTVTDPEVRSETTAAAMKEQRVSTRVLQQWQVIRAGSHS